MKKLFAVLALLIGWGFAGNAVAADPADVKPDKNDRRITIVQDNANIRFVSKVYQLKYVDAADLLPYLNSAIRRYNDNSTIRRIIYASGGKEGLLVTTGKDFMPYVDELVRQLDIEAKGISGTGMARVAYTPRYRAAGQFRSIIDGFLGTSEGLSGVDMATNTIFWRDSNAASMDTLAWVKKLDRPLPQVRVRFNYYEVRESTLRDVGFDYLAWKNGPGVNLLNLGYNAGRLAIDEAIVQAAATASSWGYGGFFFAPSIDLSFIRCLQQSGEASVTANAMITMVNTPISSISNFKKLHDYQKQNPDTAPFLHRISMYPEYQNIAKNAQGRSFIGASFETEGMLEPVRKDPAVLEVLVSNPIICLPRDGKNVDADGFLPEKADAGMLKKNGGVIFRYTFNFKNVVERGNTGQELSNASAVAGGVTLGFNTEKILSVYEKDSEVKQTIGLPVLAKIPVLKYLFSTTTVVRESTYIVVSAEAELVNPSDSGYDTTSRSEAIHERKQNDFWED